MDLDVCNRLFLELSQFATATTRKEIVLETALRAVINQSLKVSEAIEAAGASEKLTFAACEVVAMRENARDALKRLNYV